VSVSAGEMQASFVYDGDGQRVASLIDGAVTVYIGEVFEWEVTSGNMTRYYYAGAQRVAMRLENASPVWLLGDHLSSTSVAANPDGSLLSRQGYLPWGELRFTEGELPSRYQFTGQASYEAEFGLYYYKARWYDPHLGRWIQPDTIIPLGQGVQAWDRYSYVNNSPVNYTDPSGHMLSECGLDNQDCNAKEGEEFRDYVYNVIHNEEERRENNRKLDTAVTILEIAASVVSEPVDWAITIGECLDGDCSPLVLLGLLPLIPGSSTDDIVAAVTKLDGSELSVDEVLDLAIQFLGKDYVDMGNGRFLSADNLRQVRMGDKDILGTHPFSNGQHINFELLEPKLGDQKHFRIIQNIHIFIYEVFK
jgi:RHS repeat-associated protein